MDIDIGLLCNKRGQVSNYCLYLTLREEGIIIDEFSEGMPENQETVFLEFANEY